MNRRQGWMLLSLGLILALGTGALVFFLLQQQQRDLSIEAQRMAASAQAVPVVATMDIPVAARPLLPGSVIGSGDVLLKHFPLDLVPVSAITSTISLENQVLIAPIGQGETFSTAKLVGGAAGTVSQQIPAGHVLFAYPVGDLLTQVDVISAGDHLDMLITLPVATAGTVADAAAAAAAGTTTTTTAIATPRDVTAYTLQNINIFKVLRPGTDNTQPPTALLLSLTPEDVLLLKRLRDSGGKIDLVLRPFTDQTPVELPPVDNEVLISRYGLR
ncbi:MAG: Flp pilus assembly protein CpaB [Chloroflexales bacterium]